MYNGTIIDSNGQKHYSYSDYLNSNHWKSLRQNILSQRNNTCEQCRTRLTPYWLHLHHLTYDRVGREHNSDLLLVCKPCHEKIHGRSLGNIYYSNNKTTYIPKKKKGSFWKFLFWCSVIGGLIMLFPYFTVTFIIVGIIFAIWFLIAS